ncbi:MAG TPA: TonB-dependent receptor, partial [Cytophagaceae bacterium]
MYLLKVFAFFLCSSIFLTAYAQLESDSISAMPQVTVESNRLNNFALGSKIQRIDSLAIQNLSSNNLGDLLSQHTSLFVKAYGAGQMSTISSRGTGASQTAILWNGFNLQGPTLGQSDFSTIPVNFLDKVNVQYGGSSALFGSGAVGGVIHLNNDPSFDKGHSLHLSGIAGSYKNIYTGINYQISKRRFISNVRYFNTYGKNDFKISKLYERKQYNAEVDQEGVLVENYYKINDNQTINLRVWLQDILREVPSENEKQIAQTQNKFLRISSEWKKSGPKVSYFVRSAYFNEQLNYKDGLSYLTKFQTSITETESKVKVRENQSLNVGLNNTYNEATNKNYVIPRQQNRTALFGSYLVRNFIPNWNGSLNIRQEIVGKRPVPFIPSFGVTGIIINGLSIRANVSRNYRLPTFNDLYWQPGGNVDLKPELGWSQDLGISARTTAGIFKPELNVTFFNSNINNYIIWLPGADWWTPMNVQSVWSRGIENTFNVRADIDKLRIDLSLNYTYTLSTNQKSTSSNDGSLKKQLIYVPIYTGHGQFA